MQKDYSKTHSQTHQTSDLVRPRMMKRALFPTSTTGGSSTLTVYSLWLTQATAQLLMLLQLWVSLVTEFANHKRNRLDLQLKKLLTVIRATITVMVGMPIEY